jgi:hypothetical protein
LNCLLVLLPIFMAVDSLQFPPASGHMEPTKGATKVQTCSQRGSPCSAVSVDEGAAGGAPASLDKSTCNCLLRTSARKATFDGCHPPLRTQIRHPHRNYVPLCCRRTRRCMPCSTSEGSTSRRTSFGVVNFRHEIRLIKE